jgi:hypothetical protein
MKNLILTISLVLSTLISLGQTKNLKKITINIRVGQNIKWSSNLTLNEAKENFLLEYPNYFKVDDFSLTFDLIKKKCFKSEGGVISECGTILYQKNEFGYYFELTNDSCQISSKIALTEKEVGGYVLIVQHCSSYDDENLEGYFTDQRDLTINFEY